MTNIQHTILFVDDEPGLNEPLRMALEGDDYVCFSKTNVSDAWTFIENNPVSVLVADIMMPAGPRFPDFDSSDAGFRFVKMVRASFPKISIICLSVIGDAEKIVELKKLGILYLRKGETPLGTAKKLIESKATGKVTY